MSSDLRGFVYALEPLLRQRQWRVDALQARLGRLQREVDDLRQDLATFGDAQRAAGEEATRAFLTAGDSHAHVRRLHWLVQLRDRRTLLEGRLDALHERRRVLREECRREQQTLEAIEAHRGDAVQDHTRDEAARSANEADRDWLVRMAVVAASTSGGIAA